MQWWYHQHSAIISMSEAWTSELLNFGAEPCLTSLYVFNPFLKKKWCFADVDLYCPCLQWCFCSTVVLSVTVEDWVFSVIHALFTRYFSLSSVIKLLAFCALLPREWVFHSYCIITDLYLNFLPFLPRILFDFSTVTGSKKGNDILQTQKEL